MANTQIRNLLTEINALLQRPPQMANGADQVLASEEWQYREQLKQLRSRLEAMTDDSQINALEQKFRALVHQLQPLQVSEPDVMPLPVVPPLPPLKSRDQKDLSRPMPLPPLSPVGGNTGPSRPQAASEPDVISDRSQGESITASTDFSQPLPLPPNLKSPLNLPPLNLPPNVASPRYSGRAAVAHSSSAGAEPVPDLVTGNVAGNVRAEANLTEANPPEEEITADLGPSVNDGGSTQELEDQQLEDIAGFADSEPEIPTPEITFPAGTAAVGSSLEPQLLALLEQVVQKSVQQAVQQSLNTERAVILNEISQTIAQNIPQGITQSVTPNPEDSPAVVSNPRYERLEEEIANLKLQKELLNQEISRLANAQESWSSQVATMQAQQKEGLQKSLEAAVQEAVQSAMQSVVQDTLEQTIEQALQSKSQSQSQGKSTSTEPLADAPNEVITPIAPELVSQVQQQTDRFLLNLDAMFNATFQNLEHDLEGYKAAFEKKLSYIEQLEHRGEALLESIIAKVDSGESAAASGSKDSRQAFNESGVNIDLPPEIDPSYLSPVQEYVDESLIERLLSIDNEPTSDPVQASDPDDSSIAAELHHLSDLLAEPETAPLQDTISMEIVESEWMELNEDPASTSELQNLTVVEGNPLNLEVPHTTAQILDIEPSQETSTIEDLLTLFPEDELFATINEASPTVAKTHVHDLDQWQEIYADDVTIAADTRNYQFEDPDQHLTSDLAPDLNHPNQPEIDLDRDVLSHLSNLAQMLEEVENTSTVIPVREEDFGFESIPDDLAADNLENDLLNLINGDQETVASSTELRKTDLSQSGFDQGEDDVTLIASSMLNLPPLPPMAKVSPSQGDSKADSDDDNNLQKFDIPTAGATAPQGNVTGGSGDLRTPITELKIPNLTEVTADDELLSWLNDNPLSDAQLADTDDFISQSVNSESVTIVDQRSQPSPISNLQPLPLPILPSLTETVIQEATQLSTQADIPLTEPKQNRTVSQAVNKAVNETLDEDLFNEDLFNIEELGNEDESLILLPNSKGTERQEVVPWDDSLIRELAEDLSNLGDGGGANPLVSTNIDQIIRNTPFRHTQPSMTTAKAEPSAEPPLSESQPIPRRRESLNQPGNMTGLLVTDQDDPDQLFAAVIAEQIAIRSLSDDTTEAVDELDALLSGKTTSISNPVNHPANYPSSDIFTAPPHQEVILEDAAVTPFDGDTSQLFQNLEADVADLFPESLTKSEGGIEELDHGAVFHDLTSDLDDLSQALRGSSQSAQGLEQLLELADLDSEATYIITDDASTVLEPNRPQPDHQGDQEHRDNLEPDNLESDSETALITDLEDAKDIDFDEVLSALDEIENLDTGGNRGSSSATDADDENSWQRELDQLANLTPITSIADYVKPIVEEEEPLSSADFFASLEREAAEEQAAAQLNAFANRAEHFSTPTLQRPQPEVALPEILDPMEQRLTALADATERGEAEDKLWQSLFDEIERPNFSEPLLGIEREKLGLSATATDRQGALDILAETVESSSQALVPTPPDHEVYGLHDQWILGIDVGTYHLRASLCNGNSGKFYPLSFKLGSKLNPEETEISDGFSFMASYSGELTLQDPLTETIAIGRTIQELPESGYGLTNWKSLFNLGLPYKSITSWQPVVQWSDQHQVPLRWLIAATVTALKQLPQMAHHPRLPDVAEIFDNLQGVVVAQPSADADTFALNIREAILAAGLVPNPEQVMVVEQSIAPLLRQVQLQVQGHLQGHQRQGQSNSPEGISLFLDAGATGTSVGLLKGIPLAPTKHDLCHRHWDYGGNSLDQDIVLQLLYPHWRMVSNPERDQCDLSDLNLPAAGSIAIPERAILGQRLRSSAVGLELLAQAKHLKESLTDDPDQERWQAEIHGLPLVVLRRELESLVFQPYIQQINRELNTLLSLSGIFGADITKVYLIGGAWQFPLVLRWLQQKLPNAQVENLAPTAIAEGLAVAPLYPHLLNLARQQYSDYFLLREICHLQLSDAVNPNSLLHQLQLQGINIKACRDRILTILQGDFPRGLFPWQEPEGCLVQNDPSLQSELFSGNLFELNSDGTYQPNVAKFQQLRAYLEVILCNMRQTLTEPMVFPPLTTPADPTP